MGKKKKEAVRVEKMKFPAPTRRRAMVRDCKANAEALAGSRWEKRLVVRPGHDLASERLEGQAYRSLY